MLKIIGLGNLLRGDDSVGPVIIQKLQKLTLSIPMELYEIGMDALAILEHLIGSEPILIIDCAKMGKKPGEIGVEIEISRRGTSARGGRVISETVLSIHRALCST